MIQLAKRSLSNETIKVLKELQETINEQATFFDKVEKAQSLWNGKNSSQRKKQAFDEVKEKLIEMCVSENVCNYCEQNEANDIEHIFPKSFFPTSTFEWSNYLLACKQCNTAYKLDVFAVLDENDDLVILERNNEPPYPVGAFINPRFEEPNEFMLLNLSSFKFENLPALKKCDLNKSKQTIDILQLNERDALIHSRKSSAVYYYQRMDLLIRLLETNTMESLKSLLTPYDKLINENLPLSDIKNLLLVNFKKDIQTHSHPSVWHAIKVIESKINEKWEEIFAKLPDAMNW